MGEKWCSIIAENGKDHKANCSSHLMGFKVCIDMLSLNGADVSYPGYFKETDIGEMIYQLVSNGNIATLYFNLDKNDKQCQVYMPENPPKEQLKTFKENYVNNLKDVNVGLSGVEGEFLKEMEYVDPETIGKAR